MHAHLLTPLAPLVLRIGKPFGETGGGDSFAFPLPSTLAGALRTARADAEGLDFGREEKARILGWTVQGPLPVEVRGEDIAMLYPKPLDAAYVREDAGFRLLRMAPESETPDPDPDAAGCDLPDGLRPVLLEDADKSKPAPGPAWWRHDAMIDWLRGKKPDAATLGPDPLPVDLRTHVALDPSTLAASTSQLFQSSGPDFGHRRYPGRADMTERGWSETRYALAARFAEKLAPTLLRLGGESRLSTVEPREDAWPELPPDLLDELERARRIRLILATPALFRGGWRPGWIDAQDLTGSPPGCPELRLRLHAAAVERWQAVSGWDLLENRPKAVRRLAPAGSVYWFEVLDAPAGWARDLWLAPLSDDYKVDKDQERCDDHDRRVDQDRRDGFGLALPGLWT
jgi:CRISPR-associated protein Cmr3